MGLKVSIEVYAIGTRSLLVRAIFVLGMVRGKIVWVFSGWMDGRIDGFKGLGLVEFSRIRYWGFWEGLELIVTLRVPRNRGTSSGAAVLIYETLTFQPPTQRNVQH